MRVATRIIAAANTIHLDPTYTGQRLQPVEAAQVLASVIGPTLGRLVAAVLEHVAGLVRLRLSSIDSIVVDGELMRLIWISYTPPRRWFHMAAALLLLAIWAIWAFLLPGVSGLLVGKLRPLPSELEVASRLGPMKKGEDSPG